MKYDVIIIGAGVAGLFAANRIRKSNKSVLLLEKNSEAGKKLLLSGAGQCNITNNISTDQFSNFYGDNYKYIKPSLLKFNNNKVINYFESEGVKLETLPNNKVFPKSKSAYEVRDFLVNKCKKSKVDIKYQEPAIKIELLDDKYVVTTNKNKYVSTYLIIATGGMSYPKTGSTGDGYLLGKQLGHTIVEPRPGLTPVTVSDFKLSHLSGISFNNLQVTLWRDNKKIKQFQDDLLITHTGISGPVIINNSRWMEKEDVIKVNFLEDKSSNQVEKDILNYTNKNGKTEIKTIIREYNIPNRLIDSILNELDIDNSIQCAKISKEQRKNISSYLTSYEFKIAKLGGFNVAMVTVGGINMKEVNPTTMESRLHKNLYFIGEVVDIDGDTGGYNIQAAISMAETCKNSIVSNKNQ